jgi:general stress protein 26
MDIYLRPRWEPRADRDAGLIWFVTDRRSGKECEIEADHDVGLVFINHSERAYLSITARARSFDDHAKAATIWRNTDDLWWDGPNNENIRAIKIEPILVELWDGPASPAEANREILKSLTTGEPPDLGENRKITIAMR